METIAVYWESRIKTYGFNEVSGLAHVQAAIGIDQMAAVGLAVHEMGQAEIPMRFVLGHCSYDYGLCVGLLVERQWEERMVDCFREILGPASDEAVQSASPVGLLFFHGPHFGDRYGIADAAMGKLTEKGIPVIASGCSVHSVYVVLPETRMEDAKTWLTESFDLPAT